MKAYKHKVLYRECDMMRVVNNAVYVHWLEDARVDALAQLGLQYRGMEERGFAGPVLTMELEYKSSARMDDEVEITVSFDKYTGARLYLSYEIKVGDRVAVTAKSSHCFISLETGAPIFIKHYFPDWNDALIKATK